MKKVLGCLSMAVLAVAMALPVSAQMAQIQLRASVPFDFVVAGQTMPAGDYLVRTDGVGVLVVQNVSSGAGSFIQSNPDGPGTRGQASLTFHRYGSDYFLANIWDGYMSSGRSIGMSGTEQERSQRTSIAKPEAVVVLARR
jgi:hypothetical protein